MEMILKLQEATWMERLPWKRICRGVAVVACFSVLAAGAVSYGLRYKEAMLFEGDTGGGAHSQISRKDIAGMMGKALPICPALPELEEAAELSPGIHPIEAEKISTAGEGSVAADIPAFVDPTKEIPVRNMPPAGIPAINIAVTDAPPTGAPVTDVPVTDVPITDIPITDIPATDVPITDIPAIDVPVTDVPATDDPITDIPAVDVPITDVPATNDPITDIPVTDVPEIKVPDESVEDIPIMLTVSAYGNGGVPEMTSIRVEADELTADMLTIPRRLGKVFTGWYTDEACTIPFDDRNVSGKEEIILYAGWKEFPGFLCDDAGYIIGCTGSAEAVTDGILLLPNCEDCVGIAAGAFDGLAGEAFEVYIPSNITYIDSGAFDNVWSLMHMEVSADNPVYYSAGGAIYNRSGEEAAYPPGLPRP